MNEDDIELCVEKSSDTVNARPNPIPVYLNTLESNNFGDGQIYEEVDMERISSKVQSLSTPNFNHVFIAGSGATKQIQNMPSSDNSRTTDSKEDEEARPDWGFKQSLKHGISQKILPKQVTSSVTTTRAKSV